MKIKVELIKEDRYRIIYKLNQDEIEIDNKIFKITRSLSNLSAYLNKKDDNLINFLNNSVNCKCLKCSCDITRNTFSRNKFITYKYCDKCTTLEKLIKPEIFTKCVICGLIISSKDVKFSTCGSENCLNEHRLNINKVIKDTHWSKKENAENINSRKVSTRLYNDKKFERVYVPWNKGKTGIYSPETIEKIRNATIKQMKECKIKKSSIEIIFENFLIEHNIDYIYSFIFKNRQYDFYLKEYNLVVEIHGDYWHANPKYYNVNGDDFDKKKMNETQKMKVKDDIIKKEIIEDKFNFIWFWENDIHKNFETIKLTLVNKFNLKLKNGKNI